MFIHSEISYLKKFPTHLPIYSLISIILLVVPNLAVELAPKRKTDLGLRNPVMSASGTSGMGHDFARHHDVNQLGAFVTKAVTLQPREGNPQPRTVETPAGMLNSIGLQNDGVNHVIAKMAPMWASWETPVIVNIAGESAADFGELAATLDGVPGIAALELNISCPNVDGVLDIGQSVLAAAHATRAAVRATELPVIAKITPAAQEPAQIARACVDEGAAAICAVNTVPGMAIDAEARRPVLARGSGGLSGPAIKPIALRVVYETARAVSVPVIGCGGIRGGLDAVEFLMAGATAVQVGTASFANPRALLDTVEELEAWLEAHGVGDVRDIIGCAQPLEARKPAPCPEPVEQPAAG